MVDSIENKLKKRNYKEVECQNCHNKRIIRSDCNGTGLCRSCASKINSSKERPNRKTGSYGTCINCSTSFYKRKCESLKKFCSAKCANTYKTKYSTEQKKCGFCDKIFDYRYRPFSNSPGTFCSIKCRDDSYAKNSVKYGVREHRSRWRTFRNNFIKKNNNFCNDCFKVSNRLMVHHIIPYRVVLKDENQNLVTLCAKCHSKHEKISDKLAILPMEKAELIRNIIQCNFEEKWHIYQGKKIIEGTNARN